MEYEIKKKGNKTRNIIVFSIIALLLITLGVSYAMYSKSVSGHDTKIVAGDIYMRYINGETKAISMIPSDTYNEDDYYEFTISGKNTSNKDIIYDIKLNHGENYNNPYIRLDDKYLRFRLVRVDNDVETEVIDKISYEDITNKTIHVETINKNGTNDVNTTYRLYTWVEGVIVGNVNQTYTSEQWANVYTNIKVDVTGDFTEKEKDTTITIDFNPNGGSVNPTSKIYTTETTYGELPIPTKINYTFFLWFKENTTLYAKWDERIYTITYNLNGGELETSNPTSYKFDSETFTLNNPTKEGYIFIGWSGTGIEENKLEVTIKKESMGDRIYTANYVVDAIKDVEFGAIINNLYIGNNYNTTETTLSYTGTAKTISYSSNNTSVATIDSNGIITGIGEGNATITVTITDYEGTSTTKTLTITVIEVWAENVSYTSPNGITCKDGKACEDVQQAIDKIAEMLN